MMPVRAKEDPTPSLLTRLLRRVPHFNIMDYADASSVYLRRYFLIGESGSGSTHAQLNTTWWHRLTARSPQRLYLHQILRSDRDRCPHDHPWSFWSLVLWGGYWEELYEVRELGGVSQAVKVAERWRRPGSLRRVPAGTIHRVLLASACGNPHCRGHAVPAWTLVLVGRKERSWGFWTRKGWQPWRQFVNLDQAERQMEC